MQGPSEEKRKRSRGTGVILKWDVRPERDAVMSGGHAREKAREKGEEGDPTRLPVPQLISPSETLSWFHFGRLPLMHSDKEQAPGRADTDPAAGRREQGRPCVREDRTRRIKNQKC